MQALKGAVTDGSEPYVDPMPTGRGQTALVSKRGLIHERGCKSSRFYGWVKRNPRLGGHRLGP